MKKIRKQNPTIDARVLLLIMTVLFLLLLLITPFVILAEWLQ